jgi:hypothetical protein
MKKWLIIVMLMICTVLMAEDDEKNQKLKELPQVDPKFQGVWQWVSLSDDKGKTFTEMYNVVFGRMFGTRFVLFNGRSLRIKKVGVFIDKKESEATWIFFENHTDYWAIIKKPPYILVQIINYESSKETGRYVIKLQEDE